MGRVQFCVIHSMSYSLEWEICGVVHMMNYSMDFFLLQISYPMLDS